MRRCATLLPKLVLASALPRFPVSCSLSSAIPALGILLKHIGLKEPMLGQKTTSTVCFTAVRPQNGNCWPLIDETLVEQGKEKYRKGTILIPTLLVWLVLALTLRRVVSLNN